MFTKLNINDINGKIGLDKKETFKVLKDTNFISKIPFLKKFWIEFSRRLKNYMPENYENFENVDDQRAESRRFLRI